MPVLPRRDADRRLYQPDVGDRPNPHPPPDPRLPFGARRATAPPIDAGPREPGHGTRPTPFRRRAACHLSTAPRPRHHAGTAGVGGGLTSAVPRPRRPRVTRPDRRPNGPRGAPARWQSRRSPLTGALEARDQGLYSAHLDCISYPRRTPTRPEQPTGDAPADVGRTVWKSRSRQEEGRRCHARDVGVIRGGHLLILRRVRRGRQTPTLRHTQHAANDDEDESEQTVSAPPPRRAMRRATVSVRTAIGAASPTRATAG